MRIINSRDGKNTFFYCNPPYYNSDCGHYSGYSKEDFEQLLKMLASIEGKFLLPSYPSEILKEYTQKYGWLTKKVEQSVSVANATAKPLKKKIEMLYC